MKAGNFNLVEYLSNNILLENKLTPEEQEIVDDILSVSEGLKDIMDKIKSYSKKGLLTATVLFAIISQLNVQGQTQLANQVQDTIGWRKSVNVLDRTNTATAGVVYSNSDSASLPLSAGTGATRIIMYTDKPTAMAFGGKLKFIEPGFTVFSKDGSQLWYSDKNQLLKAFQNSYNGKGIQGKESQGGKYSVIDFTSSQELQDAYKAIQNFNL